MKQYTAKDIFCLIEKFKNLTLSKELWTHEVHLVVAISFVFHYGDLEALEKAREGIINYNLAIGTINSEDSGYHETLTQFWIKVAHKFNIQHDSNDLEVVCNDFIKSRVSNKSFPLEFYSKEVLFSRRARKEWVHPDLSKIEI